MSLDSIEVPYQNLSPEALQGLIESFILREGTDYGQTEVGLSDKVSQVQSQLEKGLAKVYFEVESETFTLVLSQSLSGVENP